MLDLELINRVTGQANNKDYFGSVLSKIATDGVIDHYNFGGIKNKLKLENFLILDLIHGM